MNKKVQKRLCVIIINYKTPSLTLDCIRSLSGQLDHQHDQIVVVDNDSEGNDVTLIRQGIKHQKLTDFVTLVLSPANNGFSSGNNIGIKTVRAKYYLLANADTLFRPKAISSLLEAAKKYPEAGIISPRLEWPDGTPQISCFHFHSPFSEFIKSASTRFITRPFKRYIVPLAIVDQPSWPEWTSFACVLIPQQVITQVGLLDEDYFMYYEDVDYCRRVKNNGLAILNWPNAHVVHLRGQSSGIKEIQQQKKRLPAYHYKSRARYFHKFYGKTGFFICNLCWLGGRAISLTLEIFFGKTRAAHDYQYRDIWKQ